MKNTGKRLLSLALAVLLALAAAPLSALAAEPAGRGACSTMLESREDWGGRLLQNTARVFGAAAVKGEDMYTQLTGRQQACYNALANISIDQIMAAEPVTNSGKTYYRLRVQIPQITGQAISGSFSGGSFKPSGASVEAASGIYTDLCAAIVALRYDRPELLWMGHLLYGYWVVQSGNSSQVTDVIFDYYLEYGTQEKAMYDDMMEQARAIAQAAGSAGDTYSKVKAVYERLAQGNAYGDTKDPISHIAYSALITDDTHQPVCDGYAKAVKIVLDLLDIPCVTASSVTHMWNNIKMDDGEWYNLDLTWDDDNGDTPEFDYFLVGSQTEVAGKVFSQEPDHMEENPYEAYRQEDASGQLKPVSLLFPGKNTEKYEYIGRDYDPLVFPDVKRSAWYYSFVESAAQMGIFTGDTNGCFNPSRNISRAEFASVMAKSLGVDVTSYSSSGFSDVQESDWYAHVAAWAKQSGLMAGYQDGSFRPTAPISRQEMCVVICNTGKLQGQPDGHVFPDDALIADWARQPVYLCYGAGLLSGDTSGNFLPRDNTLRSQAAVVFTRFAQLETQPAPPESEMPEDETTENGTGEDRTDIPQEP